MTTAWTDWDAPRVAAALAADEALYLDVRTADEFRAGHAPGAVHAPLIDPRTGAPVGAALARALERIGHERRASPDLPVVVGCASGVSSAVALDLLAALGVDQLVHLAEGVEGSDAGPGWRARGLPLVGGEGPEAAGASATPTSEPNTDG